jgi:hypothetical protein
MTKFSAGKRSDRQAAFKAVSPTTETRVNSETRT